MAAMDCPAGVTVRGWLPEVQVEAFKKTGSDVELVALPFVGFLHKGITEKCVGTYVEILAERVTPEAGTSYSQWINVPLDQFVLGWAAGDRRGMRNREIIFGLLDDNGHPILSPR